MMLEAKINKKQLVINYKSVSDAQYWLSLQIERTFINLKLHRILIR